MLEIALIRHSITAGNLKGRYIGSQTDEPLCQDGIALIQNFVYPFVERVYVSPMKRCVETAELIWPELADQMILVPKLRECDFGDFENKNYIELSGDPAYQAWIDSNGTLPFPGGEASADFKLRCQTAFAGIVEREAKLAVDPGKISGRSVAASNGNNRVRIGIVVHGGTIMSIMERYGDPKKSYYDYQVKNGRGYLLTPSENRGLWNYQSI